MALKKNTLVEIRPDCSFEEFPLQKQIQILRQPKKTAHIYLQEIQQIPETIRLLTDFGAKFIHDDSAVLGGFDKAKEELILIQNLIVAARGSSKIAADYGAFILKHLQVFNTVKVLEGHEIQNSDLQRVKYAGYLTLS